MNVKMCDLIRVFYQHPRHALGWERIVWKGVVVKDHGLSQDVCERTGFFRDEVR